MALLKFISLSVGSLLLLQGAYADPTHEDKTDNCLEILNKARAEVNLPKLNAITDNNNKYLTNTSAKTEFLKSVCTQMQNSQTIILSKESSFPGATAAYGLQDQDCSAAVDTWKKGFSSITTDTKSLPVAFEVSSDENQAGETTAKIQVGKAPYNTADAVNFVALYNGQTGATVECAEIDCKTTASGVKRLVCMTYPAALIKTETPYTEAQWKDILNVFAPSTSSASAAVPTVLALAAAAVGVALI